MMIHMKSEREEDKKSSKKMLIPTLLSAVEEYPISYDFDRSESINFLESLYKKKKK